PEPPRQPRRLDGQRHGHTLPYKVMAAKKRPGATASTRPSLRVRCPAVGTGLRSARFARRRRLGALAARIGLAAALAALGTARLGFLRGAFGSFAAFLALGSFLPAKTFGRGAQPSADALRLLLLGGRGLFGLGVRVELAADELDLRHLRAVAAA